MSKGMDIGINTSPECYATDNAFLQTLAYCIASHCQDIEVWDLEKYWMMNVAGTSPNQPLPKASYQQTLGDMIMKPTDTVSAGDDLNKTVAVSEKDYEASHNAEDVFENMKDNHEKYGYVSAHLIKI